MRKIRPGLSECPASLLPDCITYASPSSPLSQSIFDFVSLSDRAAASKIRISREYLAAWLLSMSGWAIRHSSHHALGHLFTFQLSIRKDHQLVTSGPYAVVRHPSYTGISICMAGATISLLVHVSWIMECSSALGTHSVVLLFIDDIHWHILGPHNILTVQEDGERGRITPTKI